MPLPVTQTLAADAYNALRGQAAQMIGLGQQLRAQLNAGTVYSAFLLDVLNTAAGTLQVVAEMRVVPGLVAYASVTIGDPDMDVAGLLQEAATALYMLQQAILAEYPVDESGRLLDRVFQADGQVRMLNIEAVDLAQTGVALDAFLATLS